MRLGAQVLEPPPILQPPTLRVKKPPPRLRSAHQDSRASGSGILKLGTWLSDTSSTAKGARGPRLKKTCALMILGAWALVFHLRLRDPVRLDLRGPQLAQTTRVVGCIPQTSKTCTYPASSPKREPGVSNRDIGGLTHGGSYTSESRSWSNTPPCVSDSGQDMAAILAPRGKRRFPVIGELMSGWLIGNQGNCQEGHAPHCLFDKLSQGRCSDLKIRTVTSCSGGKYIGRLVV